MKIVQEVIVVVTIAILFTIAIGAFPNFWSWFTDNDQLMPPAFIFLLVVFSASILFVFYELLPEEYKVRVGK